MCVHKEIWNPKLGEELNVRIEPNNLVGKDANIVEHLKKGVSGKFAKTVFYFLRSDNYSNCFAKISGKRCNLKDGEGLQVPCYLKDGEGLQVPCYLKDGDGLQVPCYLYLTGQKSYVEVLIRELQKINEL